MIDARQEHYGGRPDQPPKMTIQQRTDKMATRLKQYALIAAGLALLWFVLDNHFIIDGHNVHLLRKSTPNLNDTFVSLDNKRPESIIQNERLREAGIGDLLVELGIIDSEQQYEWESKYN